MRIVRALCMVTGCALGFAIYRGLTPPLNDDFRSFGQFYNMAMRVALGLIVTSGRAGVATVCTGLEFRRG